MPRTTGFLALTLALTLTACADAADSSAAIETAADPLEGAWSRVEAAAPGQPATPSQPGMRMFVDGHYSQIILNGAEPRALLPDTGATDVQLVAAWGPLSAHAGSYEITSSDTVIVRPLVAKSPNVMAPDWFIKSTYQVTGDTLVILDVANRNGPVAGAVAKYVRVR